MIFLPFSQSRPSDQFLTYEDGGELISFTTWAWVWRGIGIVDAFIIPSTCIRERDIVIAPLVIPSTCIRERDIVVTLLVRVCVCVCVCVCVSPLNS